MNNRACIKTKHHHDGRGVNQDPAWMELAFCNTFHDPADPAIRTDFSGCKRHHDQNQEEEKLVKLWDEGRTAREISEIFSGRTRNAVIGKLDRLNRDNPKLLNRKLKRKPGSNSQEPRWSNEDKLKLLELCEEYKGRFDMYNRVAFDMRRSQLSVTHMHSRILSGRTEAPIPMEEEPEIEHPAYMAAIYADLDRLKNGYLTGE